VTNMKASEEIQPRLEEAPPRLRVQLCTCCRFVHNFRGSNVSAESVSGHE